MTGKLAKSWITQIVRFCWCTLASWLKPITRALSGNASLIAIFSSYFTLGLLFACHLCDALGASLHKTHVIRPLASFNERLQLRRQLPQNRSMHILHVRAYVSSYYACEILALWQLLVKYITVWLRRRWLQVRRINGLAYLLTYLLKIRPVHRCDCIQLEQFLFFTILNSTFTAIHWC